MFERPTYLGLQRGKLGGNVDVRANDLDDRRYSQETSEDSCGNPVGIRECGEDHVKLLTMAQEPWANRKGVAGAR
jgi:hypothetical protein